MLLRSGQSLEQLAREAFVAVALRSRRTGRMFADRSLLTHGAIWLHPKATGLVGGKTLGDRYLSVPSRDERGAATR